jgi:hypothetical protein
MAMSFSYRVIASSRTSESTLLLNCIAGCRSYNFIHKKKKKRERGKVVDGVSE